MCQGGLVFVYEVTPENKLTILHQTTLAAEVSSICLSLHEVTGAKIAYVGLMDEPHYNLCVVNLDGLSLVAKWPLHAFIELNQMKQYHEHGLIRKVDVFEQFNAASPTSVPADQ